FHPFPNHHLRTNGFMIERDTMLQVWPRLITTKRGAYLFENGKNSLTQRILRLHRNVLVVGRNGQIYEKEAWARSGTFRNHGQDNLLIADNQTRQFDHADEKLRKYLELVTWGHSKPEIRNPKSEVDSIDPDLSGSASVS